MESWKTTIFSNEYSVNIDPATPSVDREVAVPNKNVTVSLHILDVVQNIPEQETEEGETVPASTVPVTNYRVEFFLNSESVLSSGPVTGSDAGWYRRTFQYGEFMDTIPNKLLMRISAEGRILWEAVGYIWKRTNPFLYAENYLLTEQKTYGEMKEAYVLVDDHDVLFYHMSPQMDTGVPAHYRIRCRVNNPSDTEVPMVITPVYDKDWDYMNGAVPKVTLGGYRSRTYTLLPGNHEYVLELVDWYRYTDIPVGFAVSAPRNSYFYWYTPFGSPEYKETAVAIVTPTPVKFDETTIRWPNRRTPEGMVFLKYVLYRDEEPVFITVRENVRMYVDKDTTINQAHTYRLEVWYEWKNADAFFGAESVSGGMQHGANVTSQVDWAKTSMKLESPSYTLQNVEKEEDPDVFLKYTQSSAGTDFGVVKITMNDVLKLKRIYGLKNTSVTYKSNKNNYIGDSGVEENSPMNYDNKIYEAVLNFGAGGLMNSAVTFTDTP